MKSVILVSLCVLLGTAYATQAGAACVVEKKIGNTSLCKGGKALYRGYGREGHGTWKRVSKKKVSICLPDESGNYGCEVKNG